MSIDAALLAILACPNCRGSLTHDEATAELTCTGTCGYIYPVRDGIPVLLVDEAHSPGSTG